MAHSRKFIPAKYFEKRYSRSLFPQNAKPLRIFQFPKVSYRERSSFKVLFKEYKFLRNKKEYIYSWNHVIRTPIIRKII